MAYESLLNTPALIASVAYSSPLTTGYNTTLFLNISGTTLGNSLSDNGLQLVLSAAPAAGGVTLSATSITLTLTSASFANQVYSGVIASSTWSTTSATAVVKFNGPNFPTTVLNLSANSSTTVLDPTVASTMDNFFYYITNPAPEANRGVRTTADHARRVAYFG